MALQKLFKRMDINEASEELEKLYRRKAEEERNIIDVAQMMETYYLEVADELEEARYKQALKEAEDV